MIWVKTLLNKMSLISVIRSKGNVFLQMIGNYFSLRLCNMASKRVLGSDRMSEAGALEVTVSDFRG